MPHRPPRILAPLSILVSAFLLIGCQPTTSDLDQWAQASNVDRLSTFVEERFSAPEADPRVPHGIELLAQLEADSTLVRLADRLSHDAPVAHRKAIISAWNARDVAPTSLPSLCRLVTSDAAPAFSGTEALLARTPAPALHRCVVQSVSAQSAVEEPDRVLQPLSQLAERASPPAALRELERAARTVTSIRSQLQELETRRREATAARDAAADRREDLSEDLDQVQRLEAFMVGRVEEHSSGTVYEFAYTDRWGRPTQRHGYLLTTQTEFRSKGTFSMPVLRLENVETRLRDEFGGFRQSWPFFVEAEGYESTRRQYREAEAAKQDAEDTLAELTRKEDRLERRLYTAQTTLREAIETSPTPAASPASPSETDPGTPPIRKTVVIDGRTRTVVGEADVGAGGTVQVLEQTTDTGRTVRWVRDDTSFVLDASFDLDTAVGPFSTADHPDRLYFSTSSSEWETRHCWNPRRDRHLWAAKHRTSGREEASPTLDQYPDVKSELRTLPDAALETEIDAVPYAEARRLILASGWRPVDHGEYTGASRAHARDRGWREVDGCPGTSPSLCAFTFQQPEGRRLTVTTIGEGDNPSVRSVSVQ
jgi:hypothetical protein